MNVQQILEDIDLLIPNAFSTEQKVNWMNQAQYQIFNELETPYLTRPQEIRVDNLSFIPYLPEEYHELLSLGTAKRIAERTQNYKNSAEIEARFMNLMNEAKTNTSPKPESVKRVRSWT
jgi:hypothetical protein